MNDDREHHKKEYEQWRIQNRISRSNNIITLFGLFIAIGAGGGAWAAAFWARGAYQEAKSQAISAQDQANTARKAYIAQVRAWVDVSLSANSIQVDWTDTRGPTIRETLTVSDKTSAPALQVNFFGVPYARVFAKESEREDAQRACKSTTYSAGIGKVVFSDTPKTADSLTIVPIEHIIEWQKAAKQNGLSDKTVPMIIVACVLYKIIGDDYWHHTAKVYSFGMNTPEGNLTDVPVKVPMPVGSSWAIENMEGSYAD